LITNITDVPGGKKSPQQVDVHNKTINPGESFRFPAELINKNVRKLQTEGLIAIGSLPPWYTAAKSRKGRRLTTEEKEKLIHHPTAPVEKKETKVSLVKGPSDAVEEITLEPVKESNRKR
jgi:hypothetical protein